MALDVCSFELSDTSRRACYDALFDRCPDAFIQQSSTWAEAISPLGPDTPYFILCEEAGEAVAGLPLYRFEGPAGAIMTSVPQAGPLGGLFLRPGLHDPDAVYQAVLAEAVSLASRLDCRAMTLITNFLTDDAPLYERYLAPDLVFENFTQWVPVGEAVREGKPSLPIKTRQRVQAAERRGVRVRAAQAGDFALWYEVHCRRHAELEIPRLPEGLLRGLLDKLGPSGKAWLDVAEVEGKIVAGCLFVRHQAVCDVFIMSMDSGFAAYHPNYAMTAHALEHLAASGGEVLNWQSSAARHNGVYHFKEKWRTREADYAFVTKLLGPVEDFLVLGKSGLASAYPGHYVIPFGLFDDPAKRRFAKP